MKNLIVWLNSIINKHKALKRWRRVVTVLAAIMTFVTTYALILPAITVEKNKVEDVGGMYLEQEADTNDMLEENALEPIGVSIAAEHENAVTFAYADDSMTATAVFGTNDEIPAGAELVVNPIDPESVEYTSLSSRTAELLDKEFIYDVTTCSFYDFALVLNNVDVTPKTGLVDIQIIFHDNTVEHLDDTFFAGRFARSADDSSDVKDELVSVNPDESSVIELTDGIITALSLKGNDLSETDSLVGILAGNVDEEIKAAAAETDAEIPDSEDAQEESAQADSAGTDGEEAAPKVGTLKASGSDYTVTLTYDATSEIPEGASLTVSEIAQNSKEYKKYLEETKKAMGLTEEETLPQYAARFFDIKIMVGGDEFVPESGVTVEIAYTEPLAANPETEVNAVHFHNDTTEPEVIEANVTEISSDGTSNVEFTAEAFSVYGVVYTVDFHWEVNGKIYEFSIPGGGYVSFTDLVEVLGIAKQDAAAEDAASAGSAGDTETGNTETNNTETDYSETDNTQTDNTQTDNTETDGAEADNTVLTLDGIVVSEETRDFVANVESITFSTPSLLSVSKAEDNTTVGAIRDGLGLECEYSAKLTEEQIAEINDTAVESGDWALISLKPFISVETLTVTMMDGEIFTIKVTDAQLSTNVLTARGERFIITVTYDENAGIPDDARLFAKELKSDSYLEKAEEALTSEWVSTEVSNARSFDITIYSADDKIIEPKTPVIVNIRLADGLPAENGENTAIVHFVSDTECEVLEAETNNSEKTEGVVESLSFITDSFSVYTITQYKNNLTQLDGRTFALVVRPTNSQYHALQSITHTVNGRLQALNVAINENTNTLSTPGDGVEVSGWTFEHISGTTDRFYIKAANGTNAGKYLHVTTTDGNGGYGLTLEDNPQELYVNLNANAQFRISNDRNSEVNDWAGTVEEGFAVYNGVGGSNGRFRLYELNRLPVKLHFVVFNESGEMESITVKYQNGVEVDGNQVLYDNLIIGENGIIDLTQFQADGYTLSNTHRGSVADLTSYYENAHTIVKNELRLQNNAVQYYAYFTGTDKAGGAWYDTGTHPQNWGSTATNHGSESDNYWDYYLVYDLLPGSGSGSGQGGSGDIDPQDLDKIKAHKDVSSNDDGTYDVTLGVTGSAEHIVNNPHANIIVVFDTSSSMVTHQEPAGPNIDRRTRLQRGKEAINAFAADLLKLNEDDSESIELALISFDRKAYTHQMGDSFWTKNYDTFSGVVGKYEGPFRGNDGVDGDGAIIEEDRQFNTGLGTLRGTNWAQAMDNVYNLNTPDDDPTYVLFFTDGAPSQYWQLNDAGNPMYYVDGEGCYLGARDEARAVVSKGYEIYAIFAYGSTIEDEGNNSDEYRDYLGKLVDYAYNGSVNVNEHRFNSSNTAQVTHHLEEILAKIRKDLGYEDVTIYDGITELSSTTLVSGTASNFHYNICKYTVTTDEEGKEIRTLVEGSTRPITVNGEGKLVVGFPLDPANPDSLEYDTLNPASYVESTDENDHTLKEVTWSLGDDYMLRDGYTYEVSFTIWPSQNAYDLIANLNNHVQYYSYESYRRIVSDPMSEAAAIAAGLIISADEQKQIIEDGDTYYLKTNTHANIDYSVVSRVNGVPVSDPVSKSEDIKDPLGKMILDAERMTVRKDFSHSINDRSPFESLVFYLTVDGNYYLKNGTTTSTAPTPGEDDNYYTIVLPKNPLPENPTEEQREEFWASENWSDSIFIAPGLMRAEPPAATSGDILEKGHQYSLHEVILKGDAFEYEFTPQTVRPMNIQNAGPAIFLIKTDDYNIPPTGSITYNMDDPTKKYVISAESTVNQYYPQPGNTGELVGTNRKTAELDITKIIDDQTGEMTEAEKNAETFTYRVKLTTPITANTTGLTAYEYVARYNDAPASNRYTVFGYRTEDEASGQAGIDSDYSRFKDKIYGGYTVTSPNHPDRDNTLNCMFTRDEGGETKSAVVYITLKQQEIIRFTNIPSGTVYEIEEVYANLRQADPSRNIDATEEVNTGLSSNIEAQGYTSVTSVYKNGARSLVEGRVIKGTVAPTDLDTRLYNQFTNVRTKLTNDVRAELKVKKVVEGYDWGSEYYNMTVSPGDATYSDSETPNTGKSPMPANESVRIYNNTKDHTLSFGDVLFTRPGTYTYKITEYNNKANMPHIMFASDVVVTIVIDADEDGKLYVNDVSDDSGITNNTFFTEADRVEDENGTSLGAVTTTMTNKSRPINLKKVDSVTDEVINGAVFELHSNKEKLYFDANNQILTKEQVLSRISTEENPITDITSPEAISAMRDANITSSFTIGKTTLKGYAITGFTYANGAFIPDSPIVYELVEISPPPGHVVTYNNNYFKVQGILDTSVTNSVKYTGIQIRLTNKDGEDLLDENNQPVTTNQNAAISGPDKMTISLSNDSGAELPYTGGPGTGIFMILGLLLFTGAGLLLLRRQRTT